MSMKNLLTPAGIEPATFRFVAQHLNHCATAVHIHHVTVPNTVGNCNITVLYYNLREPTSYLRSVVDRNVVTRRLPVILSIMTFIKFSVGLRTVSWNKYASEVRRDLRRCHFLLKCN